MGRKGRSRLRRLDAEVARRYPDLDDAAEAIRRGDVLVGGRANTNPASLVRTDASIGRRRSTPLRGEVKLRAALDVLHVDVAGRTALDVGAAAGGFTRALLEAGARRVYAVDAGFGQLLGSLRQDERVVNLEGVNVASLTRELVPEPIDLVSIDLSYLSLGKAVPQLEGVTLRADADMVALVKPMFELGLAAPPTGSADLARAVERARAALARANWHPLTGTESPARGSRGAIEFFVHARRVERSSPLSTAEPAGALERRPP
ncbi:MAG TPA: SAM-dependent methyltransferase [Gaiella sp.]|jgi:23S rRNA (cytidine1920-2'-O)/16S rRNA (cytidine1409-2'-O)-methyltransferase